MQFRWLNVNLGFCGCMLSPMFLRAATWAKFEIHQSRICLETTPESISKSRLETIIQGPLCTGNAIAIPDTKNFFSSIIPHSNGFKPLRCLNSCPMSSEQSSGAGCLMSVTQNSSYQLLERN